MREPDARRRLLPLVLAACAAVLSCRPLLRYPVLERHPERPAVEIAADTLNPFVLSNLVSKRLVVEIDWAEGHEPSELALRDFHKMLDKYCPAGKSIEVVLDDTIPRERWSALHSESDLSALASEFLDHDPRLVREYELVYVLYLPDLGEQGLFGLATELIFERDDVAVAVPVVYQVTDTFEDAAVLWIGPRKIERNTLIHEFGHILGLVQNPAHEQRQARRHCTEPQCVMGLPRPRSYIYNFIPAFFAGHLPHDYCNKCRADIRLAQERWASLAAADSGYAEALIAKRDLARSRSIAGWYASSRRFDEAERLLAELLASRPDDAELWGLIAGVRRSLERPVEAEAAYRKSLELSDTDGMLMALSMFLCDLGRYGDARELLREHDGDARNYSFQFWTRVLAGSGEQDELIARLESGLRGAKPEWRVVPVTELARALRRAGRSGDALALLDEELRDSHDLDLQIERARTLAVDRPAEAAAEYRRLLPLVEKQAAKHPDVVTSSRLALLAARSGDRERADRALERQKWNAWARARTHALLGDTDAALEALVEHRNHGPSVLDPCLEEDFAGLRDAPAFREVYPHCPSAAR